MLRVFNEIVIKSESFYFSKIALKYIVGYLICLAPVNPNLVVGIKNADFDCNQAMQES